MHQIHPHGLVMPSQVGSSACALGFQPGAPDNTVVLGTAFLRAYFTAYTYNATTRSSYVSMAPAAPGNSTTSSMLPAILLHITASIGIFASDHCYSAFVYTVSLSEIMLHSVHIQCHQWELLFPYAFAALGKSITSSDFLYLLLSSDHPLPYLQRVMQLLQCHFQHSELSVGAVGQNGWASQFVRCTCAGGNELAVIFLGQDCSACLPWKHVLGVRCGCVSLLQGEEVSRSLEGILGQIRALYPQDHHPQVTCLLQAPVICLESSPPLQAQTRMPLCSDQAVRGWRHVWHTVFDMPYEYLCAYLDSGWCRQSKREQRKCGSSVSKCPGECC